MTTPATPTDAPTAAGDTDTNATVNSSTPTGTAGTTTSSTLQLVDSRGEFNKDELESFATDNFPEDESVADDGSSLILIAILGARGSGKSLLANKLFSTQFPISKPFASTGTKGCVISSISANNKVLILDTQGFDGREGDQSTNVVSRVTTLSVALADAIIFNVWAADLGRYEAAGYSQLSSIFIENLRIFRSEEPIKTLIVFVIRDHDDGSTLESLKSILLTDINNLWAKIDTNNSNINNIFDFQFLSLPHIRHRADDFNLQSKNIGDQFINTNNNDYLLNASYSRNVPIEGLYHYIEAVWKDTDQQKLNPNDNSDLLPNKKELVAQYRCDIAYDLQQRPCLIQLNKWTIEIDRGRIIQSFGNKATTLLEQSIEKYDSDTLIHSSSIVRNKKRNELINLLQNRIRSLFNKQILLLQNSSLQKFKNILLNNVTDPTYENEIPAALRRVDEWFAKNAEALLVPSMRLSFRSARQEVQNALHQYGEGFSNSPTAQLQAMQRMERQAQRAPPRQRNIEFGLGINAACRPAGFGNFQLVTGYARGPHTMQFTLVNDKDVAEQEGQGQVPFFRIQPTINTTVDL